MAKAKQNRSHTPETGLARQGEAGRLLRETRESQRLDLRNVSDALRIRFAHLLAIEEGRYGDLPGATYAVGFVRAYAEHLHLDSAEVVRRFKDESSIESVNELAFPTPVNEGGVPSGALIVIALLLAGGVYGGWHLLSGGDRSVAEMIQDVPERLTALMPKRGDAEPPVVVAAATPEEGAPDEGAPDEGVSPQRFLDDATVANTLAAPVGPEATMLPPSDGVQSNAPVADGPAVQAVDQGPTKAPTTTPTPLTEPAVVLADEPPPPEDTAAVVPPEDAEPVVAMDDAPARRAEPTAASGTFEGTPVTTDRAVVAQSAPAARGPAPAVAPTATPDAPATRE
ncbi:MAG: helix-turn-helix domain-containing protein, partial [Rhodospirillaceae bacterium]